MSSEENQDRTAQSIREEEIDKLLEILSSNSRRKIIESLAYEPQYLYKLSHDCHLNHTTIIKHLKKLKENGLIEECEPLSSSKTAERQYYRLNKHVNIKLRFGHGFFEIESNIKDLKQIPDKNEQELRDEYQSLISDLKGIEGELQKILNQKQPESNDFLRKLEELLSEIDDIEAYLLLERQLFLVRLLKEVALMKGDELADARNEFYKILKNPDLKKSRNKLLELLNMDSKSFELKLKQMTQKTLPASKDEKEDVILSQI